MNLILIRFTLSYARMNFVVAHTTDDSRQLLVYFADQESVGVQPIRKYVSAFSSLTLEPLAHFTILQKDSANA